MIKKFFILSFVCLVFLSSCVPDGRVTTQENSAGISYDLFYVEGMPCMRFIDTKFNQQSYDGVSCDWSKWIGE